MIVTGTDIEVGKRVFMAGPPYCIEDADPICAAIGEACEAGRSG